MPDILALHNVDDIFGNVGGMIADAFEVFGDENQLEGGKNDAGISHHVGQQFAKDLVAILVNLIVGGHHFLCQFNVATNHSVKRIANLFFDEFGHARQVNIGFDAGMAKNAQGALCDVDGLIADAFQVVVDAGNGEYKTKVNGHQLVKREQLHDAVVNFQLEFVDRVFFIEYTLGVCSSESRTA